MTGPGADQGREGGSVAARRHIGYGQGGEGTGPGRRIGSCGAVRDERLKPTLDQLIDELRGSPADADLSQIGPLTWRRIEQARRARSIEAWLLPARAGAVVLALTAGAVLGAAHARENGGSSEVAAFQVASTLAPSTLLDKH